MATTVVMPPSNSIGLASSYIPYLDAVYKRQSLTSMFDTEEARQRWINAKTILLFTLDAVGLGNYDRDDGFVTGNLTAGWEPYEIAVDRGRSYQVDAMDDAETLGMTVASSLSEIERVEAIPEIDAYRFAKWAGTSGVTNVAEAITPGVTNVAGLIDTAEATMDDDEVPYEGRILFVSPSTYNVLKKNVERRIINSENNVNMNVEFYDDMRIIRVPQKRFNTQITLAAPTTAAGLGGYTATGNDINFMIVHPSAIMQVMKHRVVRVFSPEQVFEADAYRLNYRFYHDTFVMKNKVKGVYVHSTPVVSG